MIKHGVTIRGASGLGDSILMYPLVKQLANDYSVYVFSRYPEVFTNLNNVSTIPFDRDSQVDIDCCYLSRKGESTSQYEDVVIASQLPFEEFRFEFPHIKINWPSTTKKICVVQNLYPPMGEGADRAKILAPNGGVMQAIIDATHDICEHILVGTGRPRLKCPETRLDLPLIDWFNLVA
jgi:hypothetical protein